MVRMMHENVLEPTAKVWSLTSEHSLLAGCSWCTGLVVESSRAELRSRLISPPGRQGLEDDDAGVALL